MHADTREAANPTLWGLFVPPTIWALHFLAVYISAAIYCAKWAPPSGDLGSLPIVIAVLTAVALLAIAVVGWRAWQRWGYGEGSKPPHDADTAEDRSRFLGLATLMLAALSFVAILYDALPALLAATCR